MPEVLLRQSSLAHLGLAGQAVEAPAEGDGVAIAELPHRAMVNLRGRLDEPGFDEGAEAALGCALPARVGSVALSGGLSVLTLGPNEWLVVASPGGEDGPALRERLLQPLQGVFASVVDVGEQYCSIRISGPEAATTLQKGCPLDLDASVLPAGRCAQSLLSKADILLWKTSEEPAFEVIVRRSFADYVWRWLCDASQEFGVSIVKP